MDDRSDMDLLLATHRGEHAAAVSLFERVGPRLYAVARAMLRDASLADDAVQTALVGILSTSRETLAQSQNVCAYLTRCVRNAALNHLREDSRRREREQPMVPATAGIPAPNHDDIDAAVAALPDEQRQVVLLRHVAGLTFDQVALCLDLNRNTIASRYRLALESMRRRMNPHATSPEVTHAR